MKAISISELIEKKSEIKENKKRTKPLYIQSLGAHIEIRKPDPETYGDALQMNSSSEADIFVVYECVVNPNLKDPKLQKEFECVEPVDIVNKIFDSGEIASIAGHCMEFAGYGSVKSVDKDLKKK